MPTPHNLYAPPLRGVIDGIGHQVIEGCLELVSIGNPVSEFTAHLQFEVLLVDGEQVTVQDFLPQLAQMDVFNDQLLLR